MEASHGPPGEREATARTMRNPNLVPDRVVIRQRFQHWPEIMFSKVVEPIRRDLCLDVIERPVPEPDRSHERRVDRSAATWLSLIHI